MASGAKSELFETMPVPRALVRMAIPTIISQLINLIYNMADTWFIGRPWAIFSAWAAEAWWSGCWEPETARKPGERLPGP